jgi:hypothetical protein
LEGFEFFNEVKDECIDNLEGDVSFSKTLDGASNFENK